MDTDQEHWWKCHADQLKTRLPSLPASSPEPEPPQLAEDFSQELQSDSDTPEPTEESSAPSESSSPPFSKLVAPHYISAAEVLTARLILIGCKLELVMLMSACSFFV